MQSLWKVRARAARGGAPALLKALLALLALGAGVSARAQEFYALGGVQRTSSLGETTYAWSGEYAHNLSDHVFLSYTYLNEGHVSDHHRDGHSGQLWYRLLSDSRRFDLAIGAGPYRYYDTTSDHSSGEAIDEHGWGALLSVAAHWYVNAPWVVQLRYNRAQTGSSINTDTLLLGVGWQFDSAARAGPVVPATSYGFATDERNELTVFAGHSIVNNFQSPKGVAWVVEYRRNLTPYIDVSGSFVDEGDAEVIKRRGLAAQAWIARRFLDQRASLGLGVGPYFARDQDETDVKTRVLGLLTMSASYRFYPRWDVRASWYRTLTTYSRDTDIIVLGIGRSF